MSVIPRMPRGASFALALFATLALACAADSNAELGALTLGLTTQADGIRYRLTSARFTLDGPEQREFSAEGDELTFELASGAYRLTLLDGFQLVRADGTGPAVTATLISQNPAPVLISTGQTARVTLRFELADGTSVDTGKGALAVDIAIGSADAGATNPDCARGLRINEVDYEQASSDEAEFIEIVHTGPCAAALADVALELINGNDGKSYGRYALAEAAAELAPGERLVVGDPNVLAALPQAIKRVMLRGSGLQNGPDGVRLVRGDQLLDALAYGGAVAGSGEGEPALVDEGEPSLARCPDGFDTDDNAGDFQLTPASPGSANVCN